MNTGRLPIVAYRREVHETAFLRFLANVLGEEECARRREVLVTMHEGMPGRDRLPLRHIVVDGDRVVGALGHMPAEFWIRGEREPVRFTHDLLVDPEYRGPRGVGSSLIAHARAGGDFFPGGMWMTHPSYRLHEICGFDAVKPITTFTLVLDPAAFVARRGMTMPKRAIARLVLGAPRLAAMRVARAQSARHGALLQTVPRFDPALDPVWEKLARGYGITRVRDAAYLNWKYADHPHLRYRILLVSRGGDIAGFAIWRAAPAEATEKRAVVADFLVRKGDAGTFRLLMARVILDACDAGMESLSVLTTQRWAARTLRTFGFLPRGTRNTWVVTGWRDRIPEAWLRDHEPWHVCLGDSDGDMWAGARL